MHLKLDRTDLNRIIGLLAVMLLCIPLYSRTYQIGWMQAEFVDLGREGKIIHARVFYPADSSGSRVPLATPEMDSGFPVIVFGHGYMMPVDAYRNIWESVVPEGFVIVLPESGSGLFPSHEEFGADLAFVLEEMIRLGKETRSPFFKRLQQEGCLMGHSMGGGSAILGARKSELAKTLLLFAPLDTRPSSVEAAGKISLPSLIFAGTDDVITPQEKHQLPMYDSLKSDRKTYILIYGGTHCQMAVENRLCNFAEESFDLNPGIDREEQHRIMDRYMIPWLRFFLYGDQESGRQFYIQLGSDPAITCKSSGTY